MTPRERDVYRAITQHQKAYSEAPTRRELGMALGISRPLVEALLQRLARKGKLVLVKRWLGVGLC